MTSVHSAQDGIITVFRAVGKRFFRKCFIKKQEIFGRNIHRECEKKDILGGGFLENIKPKEIKSKLSE